MIYQFICDVCGFQQDVDSRPFRPPAPPLCQGAALFGDSHDVTAMRRLYSAQIDTSGCRDHDDIPETSKICPNPNGLTKRQAENRTRAYSQHLQERRKLLADGGNRGSFRHSHSVPAELYHGKIKQTGDTNYWRDSKNLKRHKSTRVDNYAK